MGRGETVGAAGEPGGDAQGKDLRFSVLGPLHAERDGAPIAPRAPMLGRTLVVLLFRANEFVSLRELVDELWSEPPKLARKTVQTYVYQLRKHFGAINPNTGGPLLETHQTGYSMRLAEDQLDRWRFERLVVDGDRARDNEDHALASAAFREALELWRGVPVGDLEFGPHIAAELSLLEDQRIGVLERRIDADLELGRHRSLISELKGITARHPTREGFCAQLMVAAQRSGLRADALDAFQRLRRAMVHELGLEPSRDLVEIQREVLESLPPAKARQKPAAAPGHTGPVPAQLPLDTADFVGRQDEIEVLRELCHPNIDGTAATVLLVTGGPGSGKTALVARVGQHVRADYPDGQLFAALHDESDRPVPATEVLIGFLRALEVPVGELPGDVVSLGALFRSWTADRRLLLVLDDAGAGADLVHLLPSAPTCSVLVTSRGRIPGLPVRHTIRLEPIAVEEGVGLLRWIVGADRIDREPQAAREVTELCDRMPLAVRIAAEKLVARGAWAVSKLVARLSDPSRRVAELEVGDLSLAKYLDLAKARLGAAEQQALKTLCRLGPGWFDLPAAAAALGSEPLAIEGVIEALVAANLLVVTGVSHDDSASFRFPGLVRLHFQSYPVVTSLARGDGLKRQQLG